MKFKIDQKKVTLIRRLFSLFFFLCFVSLYIIDKHDTKQSRQGLSCVKAFLPKDFETYYKSSNLKFKNKWNEAALEYVELNLEEGAKKDFFNQIGLECKNFLVLQNNKDTSKIFKNKKIAIRNWGFNLKGDPIDKNKWNNFTFLFFLLFIFSLIRWRRLSDISIWM